MYDYTLHVQWNNPRSYNELHAAIWTFQTQTPKRFLITICNWIIYVTNKSAFFLLLRQSAHLHMLCEAFMKRESFFTLNEMRVVGLMRRQHGRHLVVVGRMDIFVNTVPSQLYLLIITRVINRERLRWLHFPKSTSKTMCVCRMWALNGPERGLNGPTPSRKCTLFSHLEPQRRWIRPTSGNKRQLPLKFISHDQIPVLQKVIIVEIRK